ncbi:Asp-tRNA(Asn)/Glu-tRNA(Gln) amidotransferase subunit GatB [Candidatus Pacearchaeota archaeon]|nr:Asp-tRNA(Asn)/Glu-tRNA(Gln) amidotransferase subunit GatB [Candidatus Pacearchaeota archaeon]
MSMIGLEIHGYLATKEKLFCRCNINHDKENKEQIKPNTNICPICTGQPGSKPLIPNSEAIKKCIQTALMLNTKVNTSDNTDEKSKNNKKLVWQRKHYSWPDLPKGYQNTLSGTYAIPIAENGKFLGIRIRELHLEEDPAAWDPVTGCIDYNRSGSPLIEIVTEPDFTTAEEVSNWLKQLILTLSYIKAISKEAGIKADVNVNIHKISERTEIKNVNSISEIVNAINYELKRHEKEKPKHKETRRWNAEKQKTEQMREKEGAADYRFISDPDLPVIKINNRLVNEINTKLPESPKEKLEKLIKKHKIGQKDAEVLTNNLELVEFFEEVSKKINPSFALSWITTELLRVLNYNKITLDQVFISTEHFTELLQAVKDKKLTELKAKQILNTFIPKSHSIKSKLSSNQRITDKSEIKKLCEQAIKNNKKATDDFKAGEKKAFDFLLGEIMKISNRRADYQIAKEELIKLLK